MGDEREVRAGIYFLYKSGHAQPTPLSKDLEAYEFFNGYRCGNCGLVEMSQIGSCPECGREMPKKMTPILRIKNDGHYLTSDWVASDIISSTGTVWVNNHGELTPGNAHTHTQPNTFETGRERHSQNAGLEGRVIIRGTDGNVQVESFTMPRQTTHFSEFSNTGMSFFVCHTNGQIEDISINGTAMGSGEHMELRVNGRDTGINIPVSILDSRVANRMPVTIPIAAGAAVQFRVMV